MEECEGNKKKNREKGERQKGRFEEEGEGDILTVERSGKGHTDK